MVLANFHTHTTFCDGKDTAEAVVKYAASHGFTHLGFSGHMDPDIRMDLPSYYAEIRRLKESLRDPIEKNQLDILCGVELDILYQPTEEERTLLPEAEFTIGSTHFLDVKTETPMSVDSEPEKIAWICNEFYAGDYYRMCRAYYELESQVYDRLSCTFVGHFDLITRYNDDLHFVDETDPRYLKPAMEAMEYLVSRGVPFEINCGAVNRGRKKELYPHPLLLQALHDFGGEIVISSDAHQKELLAGGFEKAVESARACGFTHTNILEHDRSGKVGWRQVSL